MCSVRLLCNTRSPHRRLFRMLELPVGLLRFKSERVGSAPRVVVFSLRWPVSPEGCRGRHLLALVIRALAPARLETKTYCKVSREGASPAAQNETVCRRRWRNSHRTFLDEWRSLDTFNVLAEMGWRRLLFAELRVSHALCALFQLFLQLTTLAYDSNVNGFRRGLMNFLSRD